MVPRPASVNVVAVLLGLASLVYLIAAITSFVLWARPDEMQRFFDRPISDGYWALSALLFLVLAILLGLVARSALAGDSGAGLAISLLALLGVAFSLFAITEGYGWGTLALSLGVLIANQTSSAQQWYRQRAN